MTTTDDYPLSKLTELEKEIPCFPCIFKNSCSKGNKYDPLTCELMDRWIYSLVKEEPVEKIPLYLTRRYGDESVTYEQLPG